MTYTEWAEAHKRKRINLQRKLEGWGLTREQVVDYFDYDNMVRNQPDFCPLYATKTKCHNTDNLNCYLCGCPYFKCSDEPLEIEHNGNRIYSVCTIDSRFKRTFTYDGNIHCDCSHCTIPHSKTAALQHYEEIAPVNDSCSLLETIRNWQLTDIFGKFKLF
jgi:Zn-finger protein